MEDDPIGENHRSAASWVREKEQCLWSAGEKQVPQQCAIGV